MTVLRICVYAMLTYILLLYAVDHLVNNAGIVGVGQFDDLEDVTKMRPVMVS